MNRTIHCKNCVWQVKSLPSDNSPGVNKKKQVVSITKHEFPKGVALLKENSRSGGFFCIEKGSVFTSKKVKEQDDRILWHSKPGDAVGIESYILNEKLRYSAYAGTDVSACFVSVKDLNQPGHEFPGTLIKLTKSICTTINNMEKKF